MKKLTIDIVSDVVCPWCAVGHGNLNQALQQLQADVQADIHWHPFQLNPYMGKDGQEINEHLTEKYGLTPDQLQANKQHLVERGQESGIQFNFAERSRIYNTLDCHILLHLAGEKGKQTELKLALFHAYFTNGLDISDQTVLLDCVEGVGLDRLDGEKALQNEEYKKAVSEEETKYKQMGIQSVPAFIINNKYLMSGGQPVEAFVQGLTEIASKEG
jgi:predicted DsbA family dithiol-disulfide isomerase